MTENRSKRNPQSLKESGHNRIRNGLRRSIVWVAAGALLLGGCGLSDLVRKSGAKELNAVAKIEALPEVGTSLDELDRQLEFSVSLAATILKQHQGNNVLLSPVSARFAFGTLLEGANGVTAEELKQFLQISDVEDFFHNNKLTKRFLNTYLQEDQEKLTVKDSVWIDDELENVKEDFLKRVGEEHFATVFHGDLGSEETAADMNHWVEEMTHGLIQPGIKPDVERRMIIMNALYMKLGWLEPFEQSLNEQADFHTANDTVEAEFMHSFRSNEYYAETDRYRIASLPMEGGASYRVLLPKEGVKLDELLRDGEREATLRALLSTDLSTKADIEWSLPKHTIDQKSNLKDVIRSMGYNNMFSDAADFSKISDMALKVDSARQLTKLIVDNQGVEAAAYTEITTKELTAVMPEEVPLIEMKLDKPYLFVIEGPAELPLFIGAVENPAAK